MQLGPSRFAKQPIHYPKKNYPHLSNQQDSSCSFHVPTSKGGELRSSVYEMSVGDPGCPSNKPCSNRLFGALPHSSAFPYERETCSSTSFCTPTQELFIRALKKGWVKLFCLLSNPLEHRGFLKFTSLRWVFGLHSSQVRLQGWSEAERGLG